VSCPAESAPSRLDSDELDRTRLEDRNLSFILHIYLVHAFLHPRALGSWYTFIEPLKLQQLYAHPLAEDHVLVPVEA
jgi:hypothetical protein